jgi:uncharacterized damage-inducible protein DinB
MNVEDFRLLYDYNVWANDRTLECCAALSDEQFLRDLGSSFRSVRDTLVHIYGAEWIWLERWHGRSPSGLPDGTDCKNLDSARRLLQEADRGLVDYVASLTNDDLQRVHNYKTTAGGPQAQPGWQMLQHVANHSTYHRGQIATMLRQLGTKAVSTDLIAFYRERAAAQASA